ncbi:MAG: DUF4296 domain-containing protein [Flavobacteriaceae bacterium]|nr:DUF4296 domain-containing protein [Flavobacteriaceae bacterium]
MKTVGKLKSILVLLLILSYTSCQDVKKPEIPTDLISQDVMVDILTDVYISNASRNVNNKLIIKRNLKLDSIIYNKYNIDSLQFVVSNTYYSSDLITYGNLLTQVQNVLVLLKKEKDSIYKIVFKLDSIKNIEIRAQKLIEDKQKIN